MTRRKYTKPTASLTLQHFSNELGKWVSSDPVPCYGKEDEDLQRERLEAYGKSHKAGLKTRIKVRH